MKKLSALLSVVAICNVYAADTGSDVADAVNDGSDETSIILPQIRDVMGEGENASAQDDAKGGDGIFDQSVENKEGVEDNKNEDDEPKKTDSSSDSEKVKELEQRVGGLQKTVEVLEEELRLTKEKLADKNSNDEVLLDDVQGEGNSDNDDENVETAEDDTEKTGDKALPDDIQKGKSKEKAEEENSSKFEEEEDKDDDDSKGVNIKKGAGDNINKRNNRLNNGTNTKGKGSQFDNLTNLGGVVDKPIQPKRPGRGGDREDDSNRSDDNQRAVSSLRSKFSLLRDIADRLEGVEFDADIEYNGWTERYIDGIKVYLSRISKKSNKMMQNLKDKGPKMSTVPTHHRRSKAPAPKRR